MATSEWRERLRPASFRGVQFHVDVGTRASGRRVALHEFPKRDEPYAEDMGRRARRFSVTGYVIGPRYTEGRDQLIKALETEGNGQLIRPTSGAEIVINDTYSVIERRLRGGIAEFEMVFIEAGTDISNQSAVNTQVGVSNAADSATSIRPVAGAIGFGGSSDISKLQ